MWFSRAHARSLKVLFKLQKTKVKMAKKIQNNHKGSKDYSASDITVMEGLEAVRKRPGMYIGTTGIEGVQHLIHEIVDNGVDEAMADFATKITVILNEDGSVAVIDDAVTAKSP